MFTACSCAMSVRVSLVRLHTKYVTLNVSFVRYLFAFVFVSTHFLFPEINYCEWYADVSEHLPLASSLCFFFVHSLFASSAVCAGAGVDATDAVVVVGSNRFYHKRYLCSVKWTHTLVNSTLRKPKRRKREKEIEKKRMLDKRKPICGGGVGSKGNFATWKMESRRWH